MNTWIFDEVSSGRYQGINDSGIETFNDNVVKSITREAIQNSLDASRDTSRPVRVSFTTRKLNPREIPGYMEQLNVLKLCVQESIERKDKKAIKVFKDMVSYYTKEEIGVLVISDYNTTGLTNITEGSGSFDSLVKAEGYSYKSDNGSGGSFGIGKNAAFSASKLRTVFYNSINLNNERGFQGVTILTSHKKPNSDHYRLAKGFFPVKPIMTDHQYLRELINRNEIGTDVIIVGFDVPNFDKTCIDEIVNNFFMSFEKQKLEVEVNGNLINRNSYGKIISENYRYITLGIMKKTKAEKQEYIKTYQFYRSLKENVYIKKIKIGQIEDSVEIYCTTSQDEEMAREIIGVRSSGMSVNGFKRFNAAINFAGIVYIESEEVNEILQSMENPTHDKWEPQRHPVSKNEGNKVIYEIRRAIREVFDAIQKEKEPDDALLIGLNDLFNNTEVKTNNTKVRLREKVKSTNQTTKIKKSLAFNVIEKMYGGLTPSEKNKIDLSKSFVYLNPKKMPRTFYNVMNNRYKLIFTPKSNGNFFIEFLLVSLEQKKAFALTQVKTVGPQFKIDQEASNGLICYSLKAGTQYEIEIESQKKFRAVVEVNFYDVKK